MPDTRISALSASTARNAGDRFPVVQTAGVGPVTHTLAQIATFTLGGSGGVSGGNVGIGTASPGYKLDVVGSIHSDTLLRCDAGAGTATPFVLTGASANLQVQFVSGQAYASVFNSGGNIALQPSAGNVGIGTTNPAGRLHSSTTDATYPLCLSGTTKGIRVEANATSLVLRGVDNTLVTSYQPLGFGGSYLYFETNGTIEAMRITSAGNVGIGTTSPADLLELSRSSANNVWMRVSNTSQTSQYLTVNMCGSTAFSIPGWDNSGVIEATASSVGSGTRGLVLSAFNGPIIFQTNGRNEYMRITSGGNIHTPPGSTGMNVGFFYMPAAAGAPSGTPTSISGTVPFYYDTTNNQFYVYNGAWKKVTLA